MKLLSKTLIYFFLIYGTTRAEIIPGQAVSWSDFSHVTSIAVSSTFAYFATTEGIIRYHRFNQKWYDPVTASDGLSAKVIRRITVPPHDGWIAVVADNGIYTCQSVSQRWVLDTEFPQEYWRDSRPTQNLRNLFLPFGYNLTSEGYIADINLRSWPITALMDDDFNGIFIGTGGLGALRADNSSLMAELIPCGLLQKKTDVIYRDGDSLWIGGDGTISASDYANPRLGVTLFERTKAKFTYFEPRFLSGFSSEVINDIDSDDKNIYFATRYGLTVRPRKEDRFFTLGLGDGLPDLNVTALAVGKDSVWIGTTRGLALYIPSAKAIQVVGKRNLGNLTITDLQLAGSKLIIGSTLGAYFIDLAAQKVGRLKDPEGILIREIHKITLFGNEVYFSTSWGLMMVDLLTEQATKVIAINEPNGVYAVAADERYIVAVGDDGLIVLDRETSKRTVFTESDGLLSIRINSLLMDGDYLWIGSDEGLTRFYLANPERVD